MMMRSIWVAAAALFPAAAMAQEAVTWDIDTSQSTVTVEVEASIGSSTLSDADNTSISGTISGSIDPFAFPFETIHITGLNAQATSNLSFSLTVPFFGGVNASAQNLTFGIPGLNNTGEAGGSASVDLAGGFSQADNLIETGGLFNYQGVGILGASVGSGSVDLATQPPTPASFTGTITQSPGLLTLNLPLSFTATQTINDIPVTITTNGTLVATAASDATGWKTAGNGNWVDTANWSGGLPGTSQGRRVYLGPVNSDAASIVGFSGSVDLLRIKSQQAYTLQGATLGVSRLEVVEGSHFIAGAITSTSAGGGVSVDVAAGASLVLAGPIQSTAGQLTKTGDGVLTVALFDVASLTVADGTLRGPGNAAALSIADGATLDLLSGMLVTSPTQLALVAAQLASGYAGGLWTGDGIVSSALNSNQGVGFLIEPQTIPNPRLLVRSAPLGDTDLSGSVGFADLLMVAKNYEMPGTKYWFTGDFNYDGLVNFPDLVTLAQNYTGGTLVDDWARARSLVPEPTAITVLACTSLVLARRRVL